MMMASGKSVSSSEETAPCELLQRSETPVVGVLWRSPAATVATPAGATEPHRSLPPAITHPATKWSTHLQYLRFRHLHLT